MSAHVPIDAKARKSIPLATGVLDYFPDALLAVAELSRIGNEQHNPGEPLHWAKEKSTDEADALMRHLVDRGKLDTDGVRHSTKVAWRALALLQREIDAERTPMRVDTGGGFMPAGRIMRVNPHGILVPFHVTAYSRSDAAWDQVRGFGITER